MNKSDLVGLIASKANITRKKAEAVVDTIFDSMTFSLVQNGRVEIRGFGSFENREYEARKARNPRTGEVIQVEKKKLPFFKVSKNLKEELIQSQESHS